MDKLICGAMTLRWAESQNTGKSTNKTYGAKYTLHHKGRRYKFIVRYSQWKSHEVITPEQYTPVGAWQDKWWNKEHRADISGCSVWCEKIKPLNTIQDNVRKAQLKCYETSAETEWDFRGGWRFSMLKGPSTIQQDGRKQSFLCIEGWRWHDDIYPSG